MTIDEFSKIKKETTWDIDPKISAVLVIDMLEEIGSEDKVDDYVAGKLERKEKIMGIGHRIYKVLDPRAPHLRRPP